MIGAQGVGFIGLGRMGGGMARRLLASGHRMVVYDIQPAATRPFLESGASAASSPAEVARETDVIFTSLPLPEHVRDTYLAEGGIVESMRDGAVCVDLSTIDPFTARAVADGVGRRGSFIACPVGKGPAQAADGTLPLFVGGPAAAVEQARPLLELIGEPLHLLGDVEQATTFKLISNLIGMGNLALLAESFALGLNAGIEPEALATALRDTGANSYQMEVRLPWIMAGDFSNRFGVDLAIKDVRLGVDVAARLHAPLPLAAAALQVYSAASAAGFGEEDVAAAFKLFRPLATPRTTDEG